MQKNTLDWRKIKMINAPLSPDTADHPSDTPRLLLLLYLVRQIFGHDGKTHNNRKQAKYKGQNQKKNNVQKTLVRN